MSSYHKSPGALVEKNNNPEDPMDIRATELVASKSDPDNEGDDLQQLGRAEPISQASKSLYAYRAKKAKMELLQKMVLVWISRIVPCFAAFFAVVYIIYLLAVPENWQTNSDAADADRLSRETNRGAFVSVMIAILMNIIGAFMFYIKVKEGLVVTNYGFILGPVVGFMLDQGIGTDEGFQDFMTADGFAYTFSSLIGGDFMRYIVTVFLDLFISNPLQDILKRQAKKIGVIEELNKSTDKPEYLRRYDTFVALNFPSILQSIVAFVTFSAYTNQTRFAWAYASEFLDREYRIPPGTIMLSTAIAGVLYLNFYTIMDLISAREYFDVNTKLCYVLIILLLLYCLNQTDSIEAPVYGEEDTVYTAAIEDYKPTLGFFMFLGFVLYGFVYPVYTRLGCCGYCKPTRREMLDTDHIMEDNADELSKEMQRAISKQVSKEIKLFHSKNHGQHLEVGRVGNQRS